MDTARTLLAAEVSSYLDVAEEATCESVVELRGLVERLEAEWLRQVGGLETTGGWAPSGARSFVSWLRRSCRMPAGKAAWAARLARRLRTFGRLGAACRAGDVPVEHATEIARVLSETPVSLQPLGEETLLEHASDLQHSEMVIACRRWIDGADPDGALSREDRLFGRRRLTLSRLGDMTHLSAWLHPEGGAIVRRAIRGAAGPPRPHDPRTGEQRMADALLQVCEHWLRHAPGRDSRGRRPHLVVHTTPEALAGLTDGPAPTDEDGEPIGRRALLRLACDATVTPLLRDEAGVPLKLGRATRRVPLSLWRAVVARDGGCVFGDCNAPPSECDAHHDVPWSMGGMTDLTNLAAVCRGDHVSLHEGGWILTRDPDGRTRGVLHPGTGEYRANPRYRPRRE